MQIQAWLAKRETQSKTSMKIHCQIIAKKLFFEKFLES
jgi:hypothetical protein